MIIFGKFVSQKWNISEFTAEVICEHFDQGDSVYYLADYFPAVASETDISVLHKIYETLAAIKELEPKKKKAINALKKAELLTDDDKERIEMCTSETELDDISISVRPNSRSRGQQAVKKGLEPLADIIDYQEENDKSLEELAAEYVGKDETLKTVEDVLAGVKDILVERYAHEESTRLMVRDVGLEDGFFEIIPKKKTDKDFAKYRDVTVNLDEITHEEYLRLHTAEQKKRIRIKHGIQLFHITELLRHHFIENDQAIGVELLYEVIDEAWARLLQPAVEKYIKDQKLQKAEQWALKSIQQDLNSSSNDSTSGPIVVVSKIDDTKVIIVGIRGDGHLLGAAVDEMKKGSTGFSNNLKKVITRYKPVKLIIRDDEYAELSESIAVKTLKSLHIEDIEVDKIKNETNVKGLLKTDWVQQQCTMLEEDQKLFYALGIKYLHPKDVIPLVGVKYFDIHPLQKYVDDESLEELLKRVNLIQTLRQGVVITDVVGSVLSSIDGVTDELLTEIRKFALTDECQGKRDLIKVPGMTESIFRNIAGYIIVPKSENILDRSLVHPEHFELVKDISGKEMTPIENMIHPDCEAFKNFTPEYPEDKPFIDVNLPDQIRVALRYPSIGRMRQNRKLRLNDLEIGTVVSGTVTNLTEFGVFVNINAICDGLIHISELTNKYIESPEQVVKVGDKVDVRILKVDKKKKRISLSMKKTGTKPPKIHASKTQLASLADHYNTK